MHLATLRQAAPYPEAPPPRPSGRAYLVHGGLFLLTLLCTLYAQMPRPMGMPLQTWLQAAFVDGPLLRAGLPFALTLMAILLAHEMGHYFTARRFGVDQSLPYFIPAPTLFGTLGAVIIMRSQPRDRNTLLQVAVNGPYAGLVVALIASVWGLQHSVALSSPAWSGGGVEFGQSVLFGLLKTLYFPQVEDIVLHPVALAGWVGLFFTALNLIPAAQLDGGHVAYALFGRSHEKISLAVAVAMLTFGIHSAFLQGEEHGGSMWLLWGVLLFVMGLRHPPVRDEAVPLRPAQRKNGLFALLVFGLTFIPVPIRLTPPRLPPAAVLQDDSPAAGDPGDGWDPYGHCPRDDGDDDDEEEDEEGDDDGSGPTPLRLYDL